MQLFCQDRLRYTEEIGNKALKKVEAYSTLGSKRNGKIINSPRFMLPDDFWKS